MAFDLRIDWIEPDKRAVASMRFVSLAHNEQNRAVLPNSNLVL